MHECDSKIKHTITTISSPRYIDAREWRFGHWRHVTFVIPLPAQSASADGKPRSRRQPRTAAPIDTGGRHSLRHRAPADIIHSSCHGEPEATPPGGRTAGHQHNRARGGELCQKPRWQIPNTSAAVARPMIWRPRIVPGVLESRRGKSPTTPPVRQPKGLCQTRAWSVRGFSRL